MLPLNPIITQLTKLQAHTAMMAQLTQAAQGETISINRRDLQIAFVDIQQTLRGVCQQLSDFEDQDSAIDEAFDDLEQRLNTAAPAAPTSEMTDPCIVKRRLTGFKGNHTITHYYVPSLLKEQSDKCSSYITEALRYGVELPSYYHDIDVSRFTEKTYYDENGDKQRVIIPLFKERREDEHTQAFYQRVGLLLPPMD